MEAEVTIQYALSLVTLNTWINNTHNLGNQAGAGLGQGGPLPGERAHSRVRYCPAHYRGPRFRGAAGASGAAGVQEAPSWLNDVSERVCVRVTLFENRV